MLRSDEEETSTTKKSTLVFVMFYVLGTLTYVPQTFYITANDYWMYKFRNSSEAIFNTSDSAKKTDLQTRFTSYYTVVSNVSMVTGLVVTVFLIKRYSNQGRVVVTLSAMLALLLITIILAWANTDSWQTSFFVISLIIGALLNGIGACFLLSTFHLAIRFPAVYLGAILSGQSICGIMSSAIQILTLAMGTSSIMNAFLYFIIAVIFIVAVEVVFLTVLVKNEYYKEQVNKELTLEPITFDRRTIFGLIERISPFLVSMMLTAGSLVAMHPGVTSLVESESKGYGRWGDTFFVPVCTFFTFNLLEFIGREFSRLNCGKNKYSVLTLSVLRLSLIPALLFCNVQPRHHLDVAFKHDWQYFICISIFAITSGYIMNLCVVTIPTICSLQEMKFASILILLSMVVSLAVCAVLSPVLVALV